MVDSVAITLQANSHWKSFHRNDAIVWRYIATSDGVLRVYPGIKVTPKFINPLQRPWYVYLHGTTVTDFIKFKYYESYTLIVNCTSK